ncbi:FOG: GGDEF domain [Cellvibrio japonicus Ueda107]|uniref:FOG: GGDEF domain n=2 Tax=Cellvibrio japonicus TaxID=155077 RepID=B3PGJ8_CELJU|nr:DEAD/DEAH box helicase family protein [Cellvibrio japonicus]ACE85519.1 FOG: GGDEF domain [Cellvibrio japonicus Ueda107]
MMRLRGWQSACVEKALTQFRRGDNHFLCLATPGAGKTAMAATLAQRLLVLGLIDLVVCFSPSIIVASDFQISLQAHTQARMDGLIGSRGCSLTYQSMLHLDDGFWELLQAYRVLVIFDEIHHCAGDSVENANAWGEKIIRHIQGRAAYTLALTGTPWRSDRIPIALSQYCQENRIHCDFVYGLAQAIRDNVCRAPSITLVDNDRIVVKHGDKTDRYSSFADLLKESECSYQQLIDNDTLIVYLLKQSAKKLSQVRKHHATAGGLIVAASVDHAHKIAVLLERHLGQRACIATYLEDDAHAAIDAFRNNTDLWIISVGMVSEGTNIPRLRVCCHLTRVKTELHFRQVLGRILRMEAQPGESYLYLPAEPNLVEYANRVAEEIPASATVRRETMPPQDDGIPVVIKMDEPPTPMLDAGEIILENLLAPSAFADDGGLQPIHISLLAQSYDTTINMFGRFRQELLQLHQLYIPEPNRPLS